MPPERGEFASIESADGASELERAESARERDLDRRDANGSDSGARAPGAAVAAVSPPELRHLLMIALTAIVIAGLYVAQSVLVEITLAILLSFVLGPLVNLLGRLGLPRALAVVAGVMVSLGVIGAIGILIGGQAAALARDAPRYATTVDEKIRGLEIVATDRLAALTRGLEFVGPRPVEPQTIEQRQTGSRTGAAATATQQPLLVELAKPQATPFAVARTLLAPVLGPLETTVIVVVIAVFILMQKEDLRDRFIRLVGSSDLHRTTRAMNDAAERLSRYFISQLGVNACFGAIIATGLWLIGIPSPALWGVLAGVLRFVPYVGPVLAAVPPIVLGAAVAPGWTTAVAAALLFAVVEPMTGYVVEPLLYGHSTGLSPLSVIVAAVFWTWIWGPVGLILSTPLTLCLVVLGRHVRSLEFLDVLLGDRPALSPVDKFYERVVAGDTDDVLELAETALAERPVDEYYDAVVLGALQLAAEDEARGAISHERAVALTRCMLHVVDDIGGYVKRRSRLDGLRGSPAAGVATCIAGRGPFDDVVAAMLVQLLELEGVSARRAPHAAASRDRIGELDVAGVDAIVVSYLELTGSPAHLRYLVSRLKAHAPSAAVIVGLWPEHESALQDSEFQSSFGAQRYVTSLRTAVQATVEAVSAHNDRGDTKS